MMSAPQFSSKMLKNLKEQGFCSKVLLARRHLSEVFSCKDKLCSFCELPAWWKTSQTPLLTKIRDFESTETFKIWNLRSQILLTLWAPHSENLFKNILWQNWGGLNALQLQKLENANFLISSHALLVKTIKIHLFTKVRAWTIRKLRKWS